MTIPPERHHNLRVAIEYRPIEAIRLNPLDPRTYKQSVTKRMAAGFRQFGVIVPVVLDVDGVVISGNIAVEAARAAGLNELPTIQVDHLSPAEAKAFMVAHVRLVERGAWDDGRLGMILKELTVEDLDFDIELTGFDMGEIDLRIEGLNEPEGAPEAAIEIPKVATSQRGDLWQLGQHRLLCGDATDPESFTRLMAGERAELVVTDAPYNLEVAGLVKGHREFVMGSGEMSQKAFTDFLTTVMTNLAANSVPGSLHYHFMDWRHQREMLDAGGVAYERLLNMCVWAKEAAGMGRPYRSAHELVYVFRNGDGRHIDNIQLGKFGRNRSNVWTYPGANAFGRGGDEGRLLSSHPTVKNLNMIVDIMLDASRRGGVVLDPFMGSGTALIAAERVGRRARGLELDPIFVDVAIERWERWSGEQAVLDGDGRTFAEVRAERLSEAA